MEHSTMAGTVRTDYQVIDIDKENLQVTLLNEDGNCRDGLKLPPRTDLSKRIREAYESGKDVVVTVISEGRRAEICAVKHIWPNFDDKNHH